MEIDSGPGQVNTGAQQGAPYNPLYTTRSYMVCGAVFECPQRYTLMRPIGKGAYGVVCSAVDNATGEQVAIKKIAGIVDNATDCRRTMREMHLLRHFNHENVISIRDVYVPAADGPNFKDVYTVSELMATDLHNIISSEQGLTPEHCQYFTYQILRALKHIHSANVLHRDLKPSNILLNSNCDLKICDFGLARVNPEEADQLTAYVATRWYRAPEIMLSWREYTRAVDMWSVGCILAEIVGRKPLFPGNSFLDQLQLITDVIGTPSDADIESIKHENARQYVRQHLLNKPRKQLSVLFQGIDPLLCDLLENMLVFNPSKRITVETALEHPYLASLHDPDDEPVGAEAFDVSLNEGEYSKEALRQLLWEEILLYHPELRHHGLPR